MTFEQIAIAAILVAAMALFIRGWPRYDVVALLALLAAAAVGLIAPGAVFSGFGHPAVITVAAVLIISRGLRNSGAIDLVAEHLVPFMKTPARQNSALVSIIAFASAFMNNVGALAILMPVAIETATRQGFSVARLLMPLSFGAILGGMMTMIGTPPNVIIATYRGEALGEPFHMFDFTPVGAIVAFLGVIYLLYFGWRLLPRERSGKTPPEKLFQIRDYMTEAQVTEDSPLVGRSIGSMPETAEVDVMVTALVRNDERRPAPSRRTRLQVGDVLVLRGDPTELSDFLETTKLELVGDRDLGPEHLSSDEVALVECVVNPQSMLIGRSARTAHLRRRHGMNLIAIARQDQRIRERMDRAVFEAGDVLLLQGDSEGLPDTLARLGCFPLMGRGLRLGRERRVLLAVGLFAAGLGVTAAGLLPAAVALSMVAVAMVLTDLVSPRELYETIDWPVIVLLGAMIPVGGALETTGLATLIANELAGLTGALPWWAILTFVLVVTMTLSDVMNNAATAVVMAPIAVGIAQATGTSPDAYLMAVAVGASCAFLTPIGHQNNTLVMGPGGYRFSDYWRIGLPLEILIVAVSVPLIILFWG